MVSEGNLNDRHLAWLNQIVPRIHRREKNYLEDGGRHYLRVGLSAMDCIEAALTSTHRPAPGSILDFPCGFGRVLRFLKAAYPAASLTAAELEPMALNFCRKTFKVPTIRSTIDLSQVQIPQPVEIIWCGSLVTHFNANQIKQLLELFYRHLLPGGLCIFTTHGKRVEALLQSGEINYSLNQRQVQKLLEQYRATGIGFSEYKPARNGYGISLTSLEKIKEFASETGDWKCRLHLPAGWDNHQDVYAFQKPPGCVSS